MANQELHLELLLGKCVFDSVGERVGRIEEVRAQQQGDEWAIVEYLVGVAAVAERLSIRSLANQVLSLFRQLDRDEGYSIPWDKLDLSDPEHPRLTCKIAELPKLNRASSE